MANKGKISKDKLYVELAKEFGLTVEEIEEAVESQFKFVADTIRRGKLENVRLQFFGVFRANMKAVKAMNRNRKKKEERLRKEREARDVKEIQGS